MQSSANRKPNKRKAEGFSFCLEEVQPILCKVVQTEGKGWAETFPIYTKNYPRKNVSTLQPHLIYLWYSVQKRLKDLIFQPFRPFSPTFPDTGWPFKPRHTLFGLPFFRRRWRNPKTVYAQWGWTVLKGWKIKPFSHFSYEYQQQPRVGWRVEGFFQRQKKRLGSARNTHFCRRATMPWLRFSEPPSAMPKPGIETPNPPFERDERGGEPQKASGKRPIVQQEKTTNKTQLIIKSNLSLI